MPNWINGGGFYLVQATEPYDAEKLKHEMNELEVKIRMAERFWDEKKERTA